jgi:fatty acid desaturase
MSTADSPILDARSASNRKALLRDLHDNTLSHLLEHNFVSYLWMMLVAGAIWTWLAGWWPLTVVIWLVGAHLGHMKLAAFHEASHHTLHTTPWRNEVQGMAVGTVMFIPLSVYRLAHWQHHAYLASEKDPELWPFTIPGMPRWLRVLAAMAEILFGFLYTPLLFLRAVLIARDISPRQRFRIAAEYGACVALWTVVLTSVWWNNWWEAFAVGYGVQMVLTGALQTINKYTEHLGLLGDTALTSTRTVVDEHHPGRALSRSMLNIDYHGTHHRYAKVPFYHRPEATPIVYGDGDPAEPIYPTYAAAMWDTFKCLGDPKIGRQWIAAGRR